MLRHQMADVVTGPLALALLPVMLVLWYVLGTKIGLLLALVALPTLAVFLGRADLDARRNVSARHGKQIEFTETAFEVAVRSALYRGRLRQSSVLCVVIELRQDGYDDLAQDPIAQGEQSYRDAVLIRTFLRRRDQVFVLGRHRFGLALSAKEILTDEDALAVGARLQADVTQASAELRHSNISGALVGISLSTKDPNLNAADMIDGAKTAMLAGRNENLSDVQLFSSVGTPADPYLRTLERDIESALRDQGFQGWFQPQICAKTNRVTGFEALARWVHPEKGIIPPSDFLPILQRRGLLPLLHDRMLHEALDAYEAWREVVEDPPSVGLNLAPEDLHDPTLPDRIMWELDRRKIGPEVLTLEILEMVIATSQDDVISQNIRRFVQLGFQIDLDDFGTGHASISSLQQFTVHRLKIDRSFITGLQSNQEQQNMVAAILTMADQLGLDTLAEGVETSEEEACLTCLGCGHLQGFGIGKPMPLEEAVAWLTAWEEKTNLVRLPRSKTG